MALNIAVPLSGLGGLPPISPIEVDCWDNFKILVSPIDSESSGVSSLDSDETKQQQVNPTPQKAPYEPRKELQVNYNGRNILDLYENVDMNSTKWKFRYSHLPERNNISMFWANRSLYNRLGPNGLTPVYTINKCECCDFQYTSDCPNSYLRETSLVLSLTSTSPMIFSTAPSRMQEFNITKVSVTSVHSSLNRSLETSQQFLTECQGSEESTCKQSYNEHIVNKMKCNDAFKRGNNMLNIDSSCSNINKFNGCTSPHKTEMHQLTSNLISASNSNLLKAPFANIDYNNSVINQHNYSDMPNKNSKYPVTQNSLTTSLISSTSRPLVTTGSGIQSSHTNVNNSAVSSHNNAPNSKSQSSPNNYYSLFNASTITNPAVYAVNPSASSNNYHMNPLNSSTVSSNNMNGSHLTANSHYYGRMYKYF